MASLLLLRHGQIEANRKRLWHGSTDSPLTWRGRRQAKQTARYLAGSHGDLTAIYTSPLHRCVQTARAVEARLDIEATPIPELSEYSI
ncbi:MAG: histidine phosphatase family protein, partial [Gammaproteobacteria bacterium]